MTAAPPRSPILLTGSTGQVGWELRRALAPLGPVLALSRMELDLTEPDHIRSRVRNAEPSLIVNAAAYTGVDRAERDADRAMAVNGLAPGILAEEAKRLNIPLVHYSTDAVFDGRAGSAPARRPYMETDPPNPLNIYGKTKLAGEQAVLAVDGVHLILRISWIYATRGRNFLLAIRRKASAGEDLRVVDDQLGSPTWARMIAEATAIILARTWLSGGGTALAERRGLYHLSAAGQTTWYDFASAIISLTYGAGEPRNVPCIIPIPSSGYSTVAERPAYSVFDTSALRTAFGITLPDWSTQLRLCLGL